MVLQRWDPFRELRRIENMVNRSEGAFDGMSGWAVPVDVVEEDGSVVVHATVPGVKPEELDVTIENGVLTIKGETGCEHEEKKNNYLRRERRAGKFYRALRLPETLDAEKAEPKYENGILTVTLPKHETKKAKKLNVKAAN